MQLDLVDDGPVTVILGMSISQSPERRLHDDR
jgi:hypothetical protein